MSGIQVTKGPKSPGPIPERWLRCPRKSAGLISGKFLAFKTPLSSKYDSQVPEECRFDPSMIFMTMKSYKVKIGLWIDLTNTNRFYDKEEVENECKYLKLQCRGHGGPPTEEQTKTFIQICDNFIKYHPLEMIGVHCTHGFNRTGFLIVSYLVENMDCSLEAALKQFSAVRQPGIYKADYLQELFRRYDNEKNTPPPPPPELPDWCTDEENYGENPSNEETLGASSGSRRKEFRKKNPVFMEGVPGVTPVTDPNKLHQIQRKVQDMCSWNSPGFPGCQPVSMDTTNMQLLHEKQYRVSWKADGTRYMMLILREAEVYFIDRDNSVFEVSGLKFPHRKDPKRHLCNTLLDGEMVIDKYNGQTLPRYLVYDIIKYDGSDVGKLPFDMRLQCIEKDLISVRQRAISEGRINRASEPFGMRMKQFWEINQARALVGEKFAKNLSHEPDGLIFQPLKEPYTTGPCDDVLKWKPLNLNSVDFKLKIVTEGGQGIVPRKVGHLFVGGLDRPFAGIKLSKTLRDLDNKIIECRFENNQWVFMRERTDKSFPNGYNTAKAVCNSIRDPVTEEILLNYIEHQRWGMDDHDLMPPPTKVSKR